MNKQTLSEILGAMAYAAISDRAILYHDFSMEQINEAEKVIDDLIEKATPIPINLKKYVEKGGVISEDYTCPRCEKDIYEEEQRYCDFCGQRLKWSE